MSQQTTEMRTQLNELRRNTTATTSNAQHQSIASVQQPCKVCSTYKAESTALLQKVQGLERQLREAQVKSTPPIPKRDRTEFGADHVSS